MTKIRIPSSIDINDLFKDFTDKYSNYLGDKTSPTDIANIKDSILLLLHILIPQSGQDQFSEENFQPIYSPLFNRITANKFKIVKEILTDTHNPIIECDGKYHEGRSYGYKLTDKYFYQVGTINYPTHGKIIDKYYNNLKKNREDRFNKLEYLERKLTNRISMDERIHSFVKTFFEKFDERISTSNNEIYDIPQLVRRRKVMEVVWANHLSMISDGFFNGSESKTCHRFSSIFTRIKRELRSFILIDGEETVEIDIVGSHPYFLDQIFKSEFYNENGDSSLQSLFPEFSRELKKTSKMIKIDNNNFNYVFNHSYLLTINKFNYLYKTDCNHFKDIINNKNFIKIMNYKIKEDYLKSKYYSFSILDNKIKYYLYSDIRLLLNSGVHFPSYMCGNIVEMTDIMEFKRMLFSEDFYSNLATELNLNLNRKKIKEEFQLFLNNSGDRNTSSVNNGIRKLFPNVNRIIEFLLRLKFSDVKLNTKYKNPFSLLLQRIESYYFLQIGVKNFCDQNKKEIVVTVHDSVIVRKSMVNRMIKVLKEKIVEKTKIPLQLSVKNPNPYSKIENIIEEYFSKHKR